MSAPTWTADELTRTATVVRAFGQTDTQAFKSERAAMLMCADAADAFAASLRAQTEHRPCECLDCRRKDHEECERSTDLLAAGPALAEALTDSLLAEVYLALNHRWVSGAYETAQIDKARTMIVQALAPWLAARDAAKDATIAALHRQIAVMQRMGHPPLLSTEQYERRLRAIERAGRALLDIQYKRTAWSPEADALRALLSAATSGTENQ